MKVKSPASKKDQNYMTKARPLPLGFKYKFNFTAKFSKPKKTVKQPIFNTHLNKAKLLVADF